MHLKVDFVQFCRWQKILQSVEFELVQSVSSIRRDHRQLFFRT